MGEIRVGQKNPKPFKMAGFTIAPQSETKAHNSASDETKKEELREKRLEEILSLPVEEQLPLLLEEGYEEEAKAVSEKLAGDKEQKGEKPEDKTGDDANPEPETPEEEENGDDAKGDGEGAGAKDKAPKKTKKQKKEVQNS